MSQPLADIVLDYEQRFKVAPATADRNSLESLKPLLQEQLRESPLDIHTVQIAEKVYFYLADKQAIVELMRRYLSQPLPVAEEARARWELIDNLAMLNHNDEVIETQIAFLAWARVHLPANKLWWVMYDSTQALCWVEAGKTSRWFAITDGLLEEIPPTPQNRHDRFYLLRTAASVANFSNHKLSDKSDRHLEIARRIHELCEEDMTWDKNAQVHVNAYSAEIQAYHHLGNINEIRRAGSAGIELLQQCDSGYPLLSVMHNNLAASLYRAKQYDLSIALHCRAIELGTTSEHTYLWLAAAMWATSKDRPTVLYLLREGALRCRGDWFTIVGMAEFQDVIGDPEFQEFVQRPNRELTTS